MLSMGTTGEILAYGSFGQTERAELSDVANEASLTLKVVDSPETAAQWLQYNRPRALLLDATTRHAGEVCLNTRALAEQAHTPIISLSRTLDDLSFEDVFSWGGDDAVEFCAARQLLSRVRALPTDDDHTASERNARGKVVVADPERGRRLIRARVLRNAGFGVEFAVTDDDAFALAHDAKLLVLDAELDGAEEVLVRSAARHPSTLHILLAPPLRIADLTARLKNLPNAAVADGYSPPENVVFLANELERGGAADQRASRRLLFGTKVAFRGVGRENDDFGFTYNVSDGGLYVRTLAPPSDDRVWLELHPPRCDQRVRLEGHVVWRRSYGPSANATVPPGFGVKIVDGTLSSRELWSRGYSNYLDVVRGR